MEVKICEFILKVGNTPLPDVFLLCLTKHYLSESDCLSLAVSGASGRFSFLFWQNRKRLAIGQCHFLSPLSCIRLFHQHVSPLLLTSFDASHCHWISAEILCSAIGLMHNLEELSIQDTKMLLLHLLQIFNTCKKVLKLSLSLTETSLDAYQKDGGLFLVSFLLGCGRLTHLKIFTVNQSETDAADFWPVTLDVLSWCRDCVDLYIEIGLHLITSWPSIQRAQNKIVSDLIRAKFNAHLGWLKSLETLVLIHKRRGSEDDAFFGYPADPFVVALFRSMLWDRELLPNSLQRLWIPERYTGSGRPLTIESFRAPCVKSLFDGGASLLDHHKFSRIEHLGGVDFSQAMAHMTRLKYVQGHCIDDQGLSDFCRNHANLEYLSFNTTVYDPKDTDSEDSEDDDEYDSRHDYSIGDGNWTLPNLKVLGYYSSVGPKEVAMDYLMENCKNIEELHLGGGEGDETGHYYCKFLTRIQFHNLRKLTLNSFDLFDGEFLIPMMKECPKLKSLQISANFNPIVFLSNLGECLPLAKNLKDIRLEWWREEQEFSILLLLKNLLKISDHLERLVLHDISAQDNSKRPYWKCSAKMEDLLVEFATKMNRLVVLCIAGFSIDPTVALKVIRRVEMGIVSIRNSFYFHLGRDLPLANELDCPRIHFDGIVHPVTGIGPPPFTF